MRNPTVEQVEYVIKKLKSVRDDAIKEGAFHMDEARVYSGGDKYECGTVHCVGGWYAVANLNRKFIKDKFNEGFVGFTDGAELMAQDLGFRYRHYLKNWAEQNPKIWGNEKGCFMFGSASSYDNPGFDGVIAQWQLVRDNLIELRMEKMK
jgi:hypothetical protein